MRASSGTQQLQSTLQALQHGKLLRTAFRCCSARHGCRSLYGCKLCPVLTLAERMPTVTCASVH